MSSLREYEPGELERLKDAYLKNPARNKDITLYDQTWNDMNMDRVFARIDSCRSFAGEERLYAILREPFCDAGEIKRRDSLIRHFDENNAISEGYSKKLSDIGREIKKPVNIAINELEGLKMQGSLIHILCALLGLFAIAMIFVSPTAGLLVFLVTLIINIPLYFKRKGEIGDYISCFSVIIRAYHAANAMLAVSDDEELDYRTSMRNAVQNLKPVVRGSFIVTSGRGLTGGAINMVMDYLRIFFHVDLIKFNSMQKKVLAHKDDIILMFKALGEIDAFIAIAEYRRSLPYWCVPEYAEDVAYGGENRDEKARYIGADMHPAMTAQELGHPLLQKPVTNDINIGNKGVLITGSNASGKSTFLRSVGLAAILGQSIATVYARSYKASKFHIISAMSVMDDIVSGSSYYMAEIKAVKHVLEACEKSGNAGEAPVLCFVDEVLKGTNTIERIAASSEILKSLAGNNVISFAATHDIELTEMLEGYYDNYHFSEEVFEDNISFSYKLLKGAATTRNAIKLLKIMGYDDAITESAEHNAESFEKTGAWQRL